MKSIKQKKQNALSSRLLHKVTVMKNVPKFTKTLELNLGD